MNLNVSQAAVVAALWLAASIAEAQIYRWDNGQLIPGTESILPAPGAELDHLNLEFARLRPFDLTGATFAQSNISNADFITSNLSNADFTGATIAGARFGSSIGLEQIYSTASYESGNLSGIDLSFAKLPGAQFAGQDLSFANLDSTVMTDSNLSGATLRGAYLPFTKLAGANLSGVQGGFFYFNDFTDTKFVNATAITRMQDVHLVRTDFSYADLGGVTMNADDMTGAKFIGTNLAWASFYGQKISTADFSLADLRLATYDFSREQPVLRNTILRAGDVNGFSLLPSDRMIIRSGGPPVTVHDEFRMQTDSELVFRLTRRPDGPDMVIDMNVVPALAGNLTLEFSDEAKVYTLVNQTFQLFRWPVSLVPGNDFDHIRLPEHTLWNLSGLYSTGNAVFLGGDMDLDTDGDVDSGDLLGFLSNWTGFKDPTSSTRWEPGDSDFDSDVDSADLLQLLSQWTGASASQSTLSSGALTSRQLTTVPESLNCSMMGISFVFGCIGYRRRVHRDRNHKSCPTAMSDTANG
ncbi:MAG: pentapeptide repeat-containing protein [Pirellulales bacterium]